MKKILFFTFILIFACATVFSIYKFRVYNPVSSCCGMLQILFTNKDYTVVQKLPNKVVFAKTGKFDKYIESINYYEVKEKQIGANHIYSNGNETERVYYRINRYYSIGIWDNTYKQ